MEKYLSNFYYKWSVTVCRLRTNHCINHNLFIFIEFNISWFS